MAASVHTGYSVKITIGGKEVGKIQSLDARHSYGQEPLYEIGSIEPKEHVPLRYEGSVTCDRFFVREQSLVELGLASLGADILKQGIVNIEVSDVATNKVIRVYEGCSLQDYTETFRVGAIAGENATWLYKRARNK